MSSLLSRSINDQHVAVALRKKGLYDACRGMFDVTSIVDGHASDVCVVRCADLRVPSTALSRPRMVLGKPLGKFFVGTRQLIDQICAVVAESKRPWIDQLMYGAQCRYAEQQVLLHFCEIRRTVEHNDAVYVAEVERFVLGVLQGLNHVTHDQSG